MLLSVQIVVHITIMDHMIARIVIACKHTYIHTYISTYH